jgi:hypothetical protein
MRRELDHQPGTAVHIVAERSVLFKSTITERELFVALAYPCLVPMVRRRFRDWLS